MAITTSFQLHKNDGYELGCNLIEGGCHFALAHEADSITLRLYEPGASEPSYQIELDQSYKVGEVFSVNLMGMNLAGYRYEYLSESQSIIDPYAVMVDGCAALGECADKRLGIIGATGYDWQDDTLLKHAPCEMIMYKLHVRNYTKSRSSGVKHKGTWKGLVEKIPYLQELGINALELMPVYEFEDYREGARTNCWGYAPGYYMAPKAAFCATYHKSLDYTIEVKDAIKALHQAGIEVILEFYFPQSISASLADDCIRYWKRNYHIDGVHLYCEDRIRMVIAQDPFLKDLKLFYTSWDEGIHNKCLYEYHDGFMQVARRLLKGDEDQLSDFIEAFRRNPAHAATVNYITTNNGFTLMDLVSYDRKHNEENGERNLDGVDYNFSWNHGTEGPTKSRKIVALRNKSRKNAMTMLLCAQGIPLILAGDEFGNSQNGNNNAYCLDNETSWVNWNGLKKDEDFYRYVKGLIALRKNHAVLHMKDSTCMTDYKYYGLPDLSLHGTKAWYPEIMHYTRHAGVLLCGQYAGEKTNLYLAFNLHWEEHELALPKVAGRSWELLLDTSGQCVLSNQDAKQFIVMPRSIVILKDREFSE